MAKYSKAAGKKVKEALHEIHEAKLNSRGSDKKKTEPKQAIAIGLSGARVEGVKVPKKSSAKKSASSKSNSKKSTVQKPGSEKGSKQQK